MARNHYIPQFVLRHFCADNAITYCDIEKQKIELRNTKSTFSENEYYPEELERDLCESIETQFASLLNTKIAPNRYQINLSAEDMLILKKYLLVTIFRYKAFEPNELELYPSLSKDEIDQFKGDFFGNLNKILGCKSKDAMFDYMDMDNDSTNLTLSAYIRDILYSYIIFVSARHCGEDFLIPDKGYASYEGPGRIKKFNVVLDLAQKTGDPMLYQIASMLTPHDYSVFPLSSKMAVITMSPFYKLCLDNSPYKIKYPNEAPLLSEMLGFGSKEKIKPAKVLTYPGKENEYVCTIGELSQDDVTFLNTLLIGNADRYLACADLGRIQKTVEALDSNDELSFLKIDKI